MKMNRKYIVRRRVALAAAVLAVGAVGMVIANAATPLDDHYEQIALSLNEPTDHVVLAEPTPEEPLFDVLLDEEVQRHIMQLCAEKEIPAAVVVAMIERESCFTADAIGDNGNSYGLMQIWEKWHSDRMERLGVTDLIDPIGNITVGVDLLAELMEQDKGLAWALTAYNAGAKKANQFYADGKISEYAACVLAAAEEYEESRWS